MPLSEKFTLSCFSLTKERHSGFLPGVCWLSVTEGAGKGGMGRITKRENPGLGVSALAVNAAPASTVLIHVSDYVLPPALSPG